MQAILGRCSRVTRSTLCARAQRHFSATGVRFASRSCGIVGVPNVGKSTLFNALTETQKAEAANYPFCTIDPNVGIVSVPDERLDILAKLAQSKRAIGTQIEFVDIAGLVRGASKGEGLGNKFLSNIRGVSMIVQLLRCYDNPNIVHVDSTVDPVRDIETITTELMLADLDVVSKRKESVSKKMSPDERKLLISVCERAETALEALQPLSALTWTDAELQVLRQLQLLTTKKILHVCNVMEGDIVDGNHHTEAVKAYLAKTDPNAPALIISAQLESEAAMMDVESRKEILKEYGLQTTGLQQIIKASYELLNLQTMYTVGVEEARAWTIPKGATAPQAAGTIHSDMQKGFIKAETMSFEDFVHYGSEAAVKKAGKLRMEGKEYICQDGDIFHFRFNVK